MNINIKKKKGSKSNIWINFEEIIDMQKQLIGFIICKNCEHILKYDYKIGTLILKHHRCSFDEKQQKIISYLTKKTFPTVAKQVTAKKIINLVYKDLHSFDIIVGEGFRVFS